ncbi:MAG: chorismate lyase [Thiomicrospira sp.]
MLKLQQPWQTADQFRFANADQQAWLTQRGSLTAALRQQLGTIEVEVVHQGHNRAYAWEAHALQCEPLIQPWIRQVYLHNPTQPLIAARTVITDFDQNNPWFILNSLGNQPLGERLFALPNLTRSEFRYSYMHTSSRNDPLYPARYCVFYLNNIPLLLTEAFLFLDISLAEYEIFKENSLPLLPKH